MDNFQLKQLICCSNTLMEVASRKLSAINIIDAIRATSLPFHIHQLSILTIWKKTNNDIIHDETIEIKYVFKINDTILSEQSMKSPIDNNNNNINRSIANVYNVVIPEEGDFIVEIHYKNKIVHSLSIDAYLIKTN